MAAAGGDDPRLILVDLDLGLAGKRARELIRDIRQLAAFAELPVVVLSDSTNPRDINECYAAGATGYLFKSAG